MARGKLLAVLAAGLLVLAGGCGGGAEQASQAGGEPAPPESTESTGSSSTDSGYSETSGSETATTSAQSSPEPPQLEPPAVVLESGAGRQTAVQGSYCVQRTEIVDGSSRGTGTCADTTQRTPERLTVVEFGDTVTIALASGTFVEKPTGCTPDCPPTASVHPLGCPAEPALETVSLEPGRTTWTVYLPPGTYELDVFGHFEAPGGLSGDTSVVLGLLIDPARKPSIVDADPQLFVCQPPAQG